MSRSLFTVCLVAGALALASAQQFDWQGCSRASREQIDRYRETMMQSAQKFSNSMQGSASQATDMSAVQKNIDKMTQTWSSLMDMQNGMDVSRVTSAYMETITSSMEMARSFWRPALISGSMGSWIDFVNEMMSANTQTMQTITNSCMPTLRKQSS